MPNVELQEITASQTTLKELSATAAVVRKGYSPYIDATTGTWWEYDDETKQYVDTHVEAVANTDVITDRINKATGGTVNLLPYPYASGGAVEPYTHNGITYTVNPDGSITANGTANGVSRFYVARSLQLVYGATYWLSGCPEGGSSSTYRLRCDAANSTGTYVEDVGSGKQVIPSTEDRALRNVFIVITSGTTVENVTFYPMLQNYDDGVIEEYITPATAKDAQARAVLADTKAKVDDLGFASITRLDNGNVRIDFGGEP